MNKILNRVYCTYIRNSGQGLSPTGKCQSTKASVTFPAEKVLSQARHNLIPSNAFAVPSEVTSVLRLDGGYTAQIDFDAMAKVLHNNPMSNNACCHIAANTIEDYLLGGDADCFSFVMAKINVKKLVWTTVARSTDMFRALYYDLLLSAAYAEKLAGILQFNGPIYVNFLTFGLHAYSSYLDKLLAVVARGEGRMLLCE